METDRRHDRAVEDIADRVKSFKDGGSRPTISHGSTNSTRPQREGDTIEVGHLDHVLQVDRGEEKAVVEPNVPMDRLVDATLEHGLVPPVVMEFPGITVGGGIQGGAGESSSFVHGAFHQCFDRYEIITGDGEILEVSEDSHPDLFHGTECSYGSLGILTAAELELVPATDYVRLEYRRVKGAEELVSMVRREVERGEADFLDAILFGPDLGVVMVGERSDREDLPVNRFWRARDDWFYRHARKAVDGRERWVENVPLRDYLFRYDRGAFWTGELGLERLPLRGSREIRTALDPIFRTRRMYRFLHGGDLASGFIVQDICLPEKNAAEFVDWVDENLGIYPLWLCPLEPDGEGNHPTSPGEMDTELVVNVGVWGKPPGDPYEANRDLERAVLDMDGRKVLYAHQYMDKEEFWEMYDGERYQKLREKYDAGEVFPGIYETTHVGDLPKPSLEAAFSEFPRIIRDILKPSSEL